MGNRESTIRSDDLNVEELLRDFYEVPEYQREFVWGTEQVEQLLGDIHEIYAQRAPNYEPDYFIGSIVTCKTDDEVFELIDGQQRMTTIYVFLSAVRDLLLELGEQHPGLQAQLVHSSVDGQGNATERQRLVLQYEDSQDALANLAQPRALVPIHAIPSTTRSSNNIIQAYRDARSFILENLGADAVAIKSFYGYLIKKVKLIRVRSASVSRALWVFETINQRGLGLDAMDLLKNLLFRHADARDFDKLKFRWKALIDGLYSANEKPMRFIRYFVLALYHDDKLPATGVYDWFVANSARIGLSSNPIRFADDLLSGAQAYAKFADGRLEDGQVAPGLQNIWHMSHTARQHLILMMASRRLSPASQLALADELEKLYFTFIITRRPKNIFESKFVEWAVAIRDFDEDAELREFIEKSIRPERHRLAGEFHLALAGVDETNVPKYRLKYILGKMAQRVNQIAYGAEADRDLANFIDRTLEIEHILPASLPDRSVELFGEDAPLFVGRLPNLTLLEKPINSVVSKKPFHEKRPDYAKSKILLTSGLSPEARLGKNTSINRALKFVSTTEQWTIESFNQRAVDLGNLAAAIWDVPIPRADHAE